jgi:hypothetical protein
LSATQLLIDPRHPAHKRLSIKRARTIRVALIPTKKKQKQNKNAKESALLEKIIVEKKRKDEDEDDTHQIPRSRCVSSLDLSHIARTRRPSSLVASSPSSVSDGPAGGAGDAGMGGGGTSIDSPRQPAFWRFRGTGGGGALGACARTLAEKTES